MDAFAFFKVTSALFVTLLLPLTLIAVLFSPFSISSKLFSSSFDIFTSLSSCLKTNISLFFTPSIDFNLKFLILIGELLEVFIAYIAVLFSPDNSILKKDFSNLPLYSASNFLSLEVI